MKDQNIDYKKGNIIHKAFLNKKANSQIGIANKINGYQLQYYRKG